MSGGSREYLLHCSGVGKSSPSKNFGGSFVLQRHKYPQDKDTVVNPAESLKLKEVADGAAHPATVPVDDTALFQVGGLGHTYNRLLVRRPNGRVWKAYDDAEALIYEQAPALIQKLLPKYYGIVAGEDGRRWIELEDLTSSFHLPLVLDIKMGTRTYDDHASLSKIYSQRRKAETTTTGSHGMRFSGMSIYDATAGRVTNVSTNILHTLAPESIPEALFRFFHDGIRFRWEVVTQLRLDLDDFIHVFSQIEGYRFYASSVLIVYDAMELDDVPRSTFLLTSPPKKVPRINIRLIDFNHCNPHARWGRDKGVLKGLESLKAFLTLVSTSKFTHFTAAKYLSALLASANSDQSLSSDLGHLHVFAPSEHSAVSNDSKAAVKAPSLKDRIAKRTSQSCVKPNDVGRCRVGNIHPEIARRHQILKIETARDTLNRFYRKGRPSISKLESLHIIFPMDSHPAVRRQRCTHVLSEHLERRVNANTVRDSLSLLYKGTPHRAPTIDRLGRRELLKTSPVHSTAPSHRRGLDSGDSMSLEQAAQAGRSAPTTSPQRKTRLAQDCD